MKLGAAVSALGVGTLFGLGLAVSQMVNPEKVLGFLNLAGPWDPSLALVMAAALLVTFFGYRWVTDRKPVFAAQHHLPTARGADGRLLIGAMIFGVGWGLAGYCPGPAITALASGLAEPFVFVLSMLLGSLGARQLISK